MERVAAHWGWRYALLSIGPFSAMLLPFWPKEDVGIVFAFGVLTLLSRFVVQHLKERIAHRT